MSVTATGYQASKLVGAKIMNDQNETVNAVDDLTFASRGGLMPDPGVPTGNQ